MTTNGLTLKRLLPSLSAARVTHLNISLDTLQADKFERITRRTGFQRVLDSIYAALDAGFNPVKVILHRCFVVTRTHTRTRTHTVLVLMHLLVVATGELCCYAWGER